MPFKRSTESYLFLYTINKQIKKNRNKEFSFNQRKESDLKLSAGARV